MARLSLVSITSLLRNSARPRSRPVLPRRLYSQDAKDLQAKAANSQALSGQQLFRNERKPSDFDKKVLVWSGRYKKPGDIPEYVSSESISAAKSNIRVKVCIAMIAGTIIGCIFMVISGKKALREDRTLVQINLEKKMKWKQEAERERDQSASLKDH
ncbi:protein FAM162B-like [Mantella aurantiaca]